IALSVVVIVVFFFFQAEDGIRDLIVTGVQTCALPILPPRGVNFTAFDSRLPSTCCTRSGSPLTGTGSGADTSIAICFTTAVGARSEERRVGKECRGGWVA